jgi:hypothetical protein
MKYHWSLGRRPDNHPSLSELGLRSGNRRREAHRYCLDLEERSDVEHPS